MIPYSQAKRLADRIVEVLQPHCELIHIAGSIRREKEHVKDIEVVCLPKLQFTPTDLFGGGRWSVYSDFAKAIIGIQEKAIKGNAEGRYMQMIIKGGATLDLFMPQEHDYYRQLAIRTGSAEYSSFVIAHGWKGLGWCGTSEGLRRSIDCIQTKSGSWQVINPAGEKPPHWKSEEEFFDWLKVKWVLPKYREVKSSLNIYK